MQYSHLSYRKMPLKGGIEIEKNSHITPNKIANENYFVAAALTERQSLRLKYLYDTERSSNLVPM